MTPSQGPSGLFRAMAFAAIPAAVMWCAVLTPFLLPRSPIANFAWQAVHKVYALAREAKEMLVS